MSTTWKSGLQTTSVIIPFVGSQNIILSCLFFKRKGPSLTASHSVKPPLQLWCCHEARSHNSDMSFDLEMNHVRKQDRSRTSILLGQVTQRCGCCAGHSRGNVALGVVAAAILLSDQSHGIFLENVCGNVTYSMFLHPFKKSIKQLISHYKSHLNQLGQILYYLHQKNPLRQSILWKGNCKKSQPMVQKFHKPVPYHFPPLPLKKEVVGTLNQSLFCLGYFNLKN